MGAQLSVWLDRRGIGQERPPRLGHSRIHQAQSHSELVVKEGPWGAAVDAVWEKGTRPCGRRGDRRWGAGLRGGLSSRVIVGLPLIWESVVGASSRAVVPSGMVHCR